MSSDHEHCVFCWEKVLKTETNAKFYATPNLKHWICETCFNDFKNDFNWSVGENKNNQPENN